MKKIEYNPAEISNKNTYPSQKLDINKKNYSSKLLVNPFKINQY